MYKSSKRLVNKMARLALTKKAEDVISMDLRGLVSTCDFFMICHGTTDVHVKAKKGRTPLLLAAAIGHTAVAELLVAKGR